MLRRPLVVVLATSGVPYVGLVGFLLFEHWTVEAITRPEGGFFSILAVVGGLVPLTALVIVFLRLVRDTSRFRVSVLLELYAGMLVVFASLDSLLQCAATKAAFAGAPMLWDGTAHSLADHIERTHAVFGTMLYFSVVTMTTLGFGDITPVSASARVLTAAQALCGVSFVSVSVGYYFAVCSSRRC